jgi:hypothetical protein
LQSCRQRSSFSLTSLKSKNISAGYQYDAARGAGAGGRCPGDREVFPWTPVILALHTSMQGQDAHGLTIAVLMGSAALMLLTRRGTAVRKLSALLLGGSAALVMFELQYAFLPLLPGISGP